MDSWSARIGSTRRSAVSTSAGIAFAAPPRPPPPFAAVFIVHARDRLQLGGLLLGRGVVQKVAAPDFGAGEVLEQSLLAQRRVNLDVKVKARIRAIGGRLVQHPDLRESPPPHNFRDKQKAPDPHPRTPQPPRP